MQSRQGMPVGAILRLQISTIHYFQVRQSHGHPPSGRRIVIQLLQRRKDVVETESVRETRNLTKGRLRFDHVHIRRPGRKDHSLFVGRKPGVVHDIVGCVVMRDRMEKGFNVVGGTFLPGLCRVSLFLLSSRDDLI